MILTAQSTTTITGTSAESVPYYYGHITRENAELILFDRGCMDGMYLLRASCGSNHNNNDDNDNNNQQEQADSSSGYVLSLCHGKQVVHYRIVRDKADGLCHLSGMPHDKYAGPVELIQAVPEFAGFLTVPCLKPLDVFMPGVNCSISEERVKEAVRKKSTEWGIQESDFASMFDDKRSEIWRLVLKTLHEYEPWFYGRITREEAEAKLLDSGMRNGKFLVRERDPSSFTLSLCHEGLIKHYKIDVLSTGEVGIQDGPRFENIISLVSHYSVFSDGLWCQLQEPCISITDNSASGNARQSVINRLEQMCSSNGKSIYPVLPKDDDNRVSTNGVGPAKSPTSGASMSAANKSSSKKATSIWFINHLPKLSKDARPKSPQNGGEKIAAATTPVPAASSTAAAAAVTKKPKKVALKSPKSKNSNSKVGKLTKLDISSPVISRPAPPPPPPSASSPPTPSESNQDANSNTISPRDESGKLPPNPPIIDGELSASTQVPLMCPLPPLVVLTAVTTAQDSSLPIKRPLPAPRHRRAVPIPVELTIDAVPPSPLSPNGPSSSCSARKSSGLIFSYPPSTATTTSTSSPVENKSASNESLSYERFANDASPKESGSPKAFRWMKNANSTGPNMLNVIEELKGRTSVMKTGCEVDDNEATDNENGQTNTTCTDSDEMPHYEEIDPDFDEIEPAYDDPKLLSTEQLLPEESLLDPQIENAEWDQTRDRADSNRATKFERRKPPWTKEESELHFKTIRRYRKGPTAIDRKNLVLQEQIGVGNFGDVIKAVFKLGDVEVPCAIKTLKKEAISSGKEDILREARIMTKLDHPHIVRLFGVSEGDPFLLVMELASLGPLNSYVRKNFDVSPRDILLLLYQVALGMEYLESKQFVHRDLAARNVLLVNESFAKISDFGMSRALGLHSDYYRVEPQAKLPLKWYAPECIYYFRFSCKSDVWSYGITMWEALSYGERPYLGLTGHEILTMFSTNRRLACPEKCSPQIYAIMWQCWQFRPEDRPTFAELKSILRDQLNI